MRGGAVTVTELNNYLHDILASEEHNWRVRLPPKGDFIVNFPSEMVMDEFLRKGEVGFGPVKVVFRK